MNDTTDRPPRQPTGHPGGNADPPPLLTEDPEVLFRDAIELSGLRPYVLRQLALVGAVRHRWFEGRPVVDLVDLVEAMDAAPRLSSPPRRGRGER